MDVEVKPALQKPLDFHKKDYEIFRYVDDYFIFYNEESAKSEILQTVQEALKKKAQHKPAKVKPYEKPIITEITIAKDRILGLLDSEIDPKVEVKEKKESIRLLCGSFESSNHWVQDHHQGVRSQIRRSPQLHVRDH